MGAGDLVQSNIDKDYITLEEYKIYDKALIVTNMQMQTYYAESNVTGELYAAK